MKTVKILAKEREQALFNHKRKQTFDSTDSREEYVRTSKQSQCCQVKIFNGGRIISQKTVDQMFVFFCD